MLSPRHTQAYTHFCCRNLCYFDSEDVMCCIFPISVVLESRKRLCPHFDYRGDSGETFQVSLHSSHAQCVRDGEAQMLSRNVVRAPTSFFCGPGLLIFSSCRASLSCVDCYCILSQRPCVICSCAFFPQLILTFRPKHGFTFVVIRLRCVVDCQNKGPYHWSRSPRTSKTEDSILSSNSVLPKA